MARTKLEYSQDRDKISKLLAKSVTRPSDISTMLKMDLKTVNNDLMFMRNNSRKWLAGYAAAGYVQVTKQTIEQMNDLEIELQQMRQDLTPAKEQPPSTTTEMETRLHVIKELRETINTRWVIEGNGPTMMQLQAMQDENNANQGTKSS